MGEDSQTPKMRWLVIAVLAILSMGLQAEVVAGMELHHEKSLPVAAGRVTSVEFDNSGRFLAYGTRHGEIYTYDTELERTAANPTEHGDAVTCFAFDEEGQYLVSGSKDDKIIIWDRYSQEPVHVIRDFKSDVTCLALAPGDRVMAACGSRKEVYLWEFPSGQSRGRLKGLKKDAVSLAFGRNGASLMAIDKEGNTVIWDVRSLQKIRSTEVSGRTLPNSGIDVRSAQVSADRSVVAVGLREHVLEKGGRKVIFRHNVAFSRWDSGQEFALLQGNRSAVDLLALSPDTRYLVTENSTLQKPQLSVWNIRNENIEYNQPIDGDVTAVAFSQNGKWLAACYTENESARRSFVRLWRVTGVEGGPPLSGPSTLPKDDPFGCPITVLPTDRPLIGLGPQRVVAVMEFAASGLGDQGGDIGMTAANRLESLIAGSELITIVERSRIDLVLDELKYQQSGLTESQAAEIGKHLGADYVLLGLISRLGRDLSMTVKLVNVESAVIDGGRTAECENGRIEDVARLIDVLARSIAER